MAEELPREDDLIIKFEQPPIQGHKHYFNSTITLSAMPENFSFIEDPNPPVTIIVRQEPPNTSLNI